MQGSERAAANSITTTHGIEVEAAAQLLEGRSMPERKRWLYAYRIRIRNVGDIPQRLVSRHWVITDAQGEQREVRGDGVVGEQPRLEPGESHEYHSMADLSTPWGTMEGTYRFVTDEGDERDIVIGRFFLAESADNTIVAE
ncbi:MAG: Co2+/Mg2+ efflux protein ApaG [Planctomycetota bacterium]